MTTGVEPPDVWLPAPPADPNVDEAPPRRSWFGKAAAVLGIVVGMVWIVPGLFAWRSYRRWGRGEIRRPTFAWTVAVVVPLMWIVIGVTGFVLLYGAPLLEEDFADQSNHWHTSGPPNTAGFVDGAFEMGVGSGIVGDGGLSGLRWLEGSRPNVAVETDVRMIEGGDGYAGIGCFNADREVGYVFVVTTTGRYEIREMSGAPGPPLAEGPVAGDLRDGLRIRGECRGGYGDHELRMFVDGALVRTLAVPDEIFDYSAVGLIVAATSTDEVRSRFDNVFAIAIQPSAGD